MDLVIYSGNVAFCFSYLCCAVLYVVDILVCLSVLVYVLACVHLVFDVGWFVFVFVLEYITR